MKNARRLALVWFVAMGAAAYVTTPRAIESDECHWTDGEGCTSSQWGSIGSVGSCNTAHGCLEAQAWCDQRCGGIAWFDCVDPENPPTSFVCRCDYCEDGL